MLAGAQRCAAANPKRAPRSFEETLLPRLPAEEQERLLRVAEEEQERSRISRVKE